MFRHKSTFTARHVPGGFVPGYWGWGDAYVAVSKWRLEGLKTLPDCDR